MEKNSKVIDLSVLKELVSDDVVNGILNNSPKKVSMRVAKAADHLLKVEKIIGIDDEMAALRLIAAEEELVVAIFESVKINFKAHEFYVPVTKKYKIHEVKLTLYPVLMKFRHIIEGIAFSGEGEIEGIRIPIRSRFEFENGKLLFKFGFKENDFSLSHNPLSSAVTMDGKSPDEVIEELYKDFEELVREQSGKSVKEFVNSRSDYRNKILYATDGNVYSMGESARDLIDSAFKPSVRDLLWCLLIIDTYGKQRSSVFLVKQFFSFYQYVLTKAGVKFK